MSKVAGLIQELQSKIPQMELVNSSVSASSVGWHIAHTLLVNNRIITGLGKSNAADYKGKFSVKKIIILITGKIPRGRGKAPDAVMPSNDFTAASLQQHVDTALQKIKELDALQSNNFIEHPVFGNLNLKNTKRFLEIHARHHLRIIDDIIRAENKVGK
jgi:DinB superfamily